MIILWQSIRMSWNSVDLRRKYTVWTQDGPKRLIIGPHLIIRPSLSTSVRKIFHIHQMD